MKEFDQNTNSRVLHIQPLSSQNSSIIRLYKKCISRASPLMEKKLLGSKAKGNGSMHFSMANWDCTYKLRKGGCLWCWKYLSSRGNLPAGRQSTKIIKHCVKNKKHYKRYHYYFDHCTEFTWTFFATNSNYLLLAWLQWIMNQILHFMLCYFSNVMNKITILFPSHWQHIITEIRFTIPSTSCS